MQNQFIFLHKWVGKRKFRCFVDSANISTATENSSSISEEVLLDPGKLMEIFL